MTSREDLFRIVRFGIAGAIATSTNIPAFLFATDVLRLSYLPASVVAFFAGFFVSFTLQKFWTFRDREMGVIGQQGLVYLFIILLNLGLNTLLVYVFVEYAGVGPIVALLVSSGLIAFESYFAYHYLVFFAPRSAVPVLPSPQGKGDPMLSVILLCYKAGENALPVIREMRESLEQRGIPYQLILVANYNAEDTNDRTPQIARSAVAGDPRTMVVANEKRGWYGWDVKSGFAAATGDVVAYIDGDGQDPVEDIVHLYDALVAEHADFGIGYRVRRHDGFLRILISRMYVVLLRLLFPRVNLFDANSKPKMLTRAALSRLTLRSDDWFIDAEIVIQACYKGFKVVQVPTMLLKQQHRSSFVNIRAVWKFTSDLIRYRFDPRASWRDRS
ncbi:GtrA family protein [Candidatus Kaiserbacteria bacterium]|nr:GtrA family protein [Candidatus Kaiserbacteria bacterium]